MTTTAMAVTGIAAAYGVRRALILLANSAKPLRGVCQQYQPSPLCFIETQSGEGSRRSRR